MCARPAPPAAIPAPAAVADGSVPLHTGVEEAPAFELVRPVGREGILHAAPQRQPAVALLIVELPAHVIVAVVDMGIGVDLKAAAVVGHRQFRVHGADGGDDLVQCAPVHGLAPVVVAAEALVALVHRRRQFLTAVLAVALAADVAVADHGASEPAVPVQPVAVEVVVLRQLADDVLDVLARRSEQADHRPLVARRHQRRRAGAYYRAAVGVARGVGGHQAAAPFARGLHVVQRRHIDRPARRGELVHQVTVADATVLVTVLGIVIAVALVVLGVHVQRLDAGPVQPPHDVRGIDGAQVGGLADRHLVGRVGHLEIQQVDPLALLEPLAFTHVVTPHVAQV